MNHKTIYPGYFKAKITNHMNNHSKVMHPGHWISIYSQWKHRSETKGIILLKMCKLWCILNLFVSFHWFLCYSVATVMATEVKVSYPFPGSKSGKYHMPYSNKSDNVLSNKAIDWPFQHWIFGENGKKMEKVVFLPVSSNLYVISFRLLV
jgi:hypothetical protein